VLQVARADGGVTSNWIHDQLAIGESVKVSGAYGTFIGDPSWTPRFSASPPAPASPRAGLAEAALRRGFKKPVTMLFSARTKEDVYSQGMMAWWRTKHRTFDYKITLTREEKGLPPGASMSCCRSCSRICRSTPSSSPAARSSSIAASPPPRPRAQDELIHTEGFFAQQQPVVADADHLLPL
jgi:CDP-4-dehydro-6-deoxyglucose reductase